MKILLLLIWLLSSLSFWLFAVATKIDNPKFKHYEFIVRTAFYWIAIIASLFFGIGVGKYIG